jgi:hypothetical protein
MVPDMALTARMSAVSGAAWGHHHPGVPAHH